MKLIQKLFVNDPVELILKNGINLKQKIFLDLDKNDFFSCKIYIYLIFIAVIFV